jgi:hypothetical protein
VSVELPEKVKIALHDYRVEYWDPRDACAANRYGETDRNSKVIRIDTQYSPRKAAETLFHEIMHATWYEWTVRVGDEEERCVETLSSALCAVFRDNPGFLAWLDRALNDGNRDSPA